MRSDDTHDPIVERLRRLQLLAPDQERMTAFGLDVARSSAEVGDIGGVHTHLLDLNGARLGQLSSRPSASSMSSGWWRRRSASIDSSSEPRRQFASVQISPGGSPRGGGGNAW